MIDTGDQGVRHCELSLPRRNGGLTSYSASPSTVNACDSAIAKEYSRESHSKTSPCISLPSRASWRATNYPAETRAHVSTRATLGCFFVLEHTTYPAPRNNPAAMRREDVLEMIKQTAEASSRDFILIDSRRNDHEISRIYGSSTLLWNKLSKAGRYPT